MTTPLPTPTEPSAPLSEADVAALTLALQAENAAIYSYGLITAYGSDARREQVAVHTAAHRARRDAAIELLEAGGATAPAAAAGYTVPFPVTDPTSAAWLAVLSEDEAAAAWLSALEQAEAEPVRAMAVDNLTDSAVRAGKWRVALGEAPPTTAFPGRPR